MTKRFKGDIQVENDAQIDNNLSLPSQTGSRALELDGSGNVTSSTVTSTELARLSGVTGDIQTQLDAKQETSEKGAANGYASLDATGKVPSSQIPAVAITEVFEAADITARDALTIGSGAGEVQEGDVVIVTDASADAAITSGAASYIYDGAAYKLLKAGDEVLSVNGETGVVTLNTDDITEGSNQYHTTARARAAAVADSITDGVTDVAPSQNAVFDALAALSDSDENVKVSANDTTAGYLEDKIVASNGVNSTNPLEASTLNDGGDEDLQIQFDESKVDHNNLNNYVANEHVDHSSVNINTNADSGLTGGGDITASRTLSVDINGTTSETSVADGDEILIYDVSAGALRKMTKANFVGNQGASAGDINETSFSGANNQAAAADVTGFAFANGTVRSFSAHVSILVDATADLYETYQIEGIQKAAGWDISQSSTGDDSNVNFSITSAGQIQYTSDNYAGFVSLTIKFRAITTSV